MRAEIPPQAELRVPPQTETQDRLRLHRPIRLGGTSRLQRKRLSGLVTNPATCALQAFCWKPSIQPRIEKRPKLNFSGRAKNSFQG